MKFGQVTNPEAIDFRLPEDHPDTEKALKEGKNSLSISIGCAKWNKTDLKNFYPKGVKDELTYYSTQFNSIELNATFYNLPSAKQVKTWKEKTPANFRFFPKITNTVSHYKRLLQVKSVVDEFCDSIAHFEEKLGMVFLQLHDNFKPKDIGRLEKFVLEFPRGIPLAIEVRNSEWFQDQLASDEYFGLLETNNVTNIIVDTAGRRDMLHMRLTTPSVFIRYVGANHSSDYARLDDWLERIVLWKQQGLGNLGFFVHQNIERASPLLSAYFIKKFNERIGTSLHVPVTVSDRVAH